MQSVLQVTENTDLRGLLSQLAERAAEHRFDVAPNPCVGAAVLGPDGRVLAEGFHRRWGGPHAEVEALATARAAGVADEQLHTLVVTLEPCSSHGKTPPGTDAVLAAGFRRVVVGELDPDPRHGGRGLDLLRRAGVEVERVAFAAPLEVASPHFVRWTAHERLRRPRPWVIAKWAQTRTGQLSPPEGTGEGRWISGPESLREVQHLRAAVDAIVTGVGTVRADDPLLTVRPPAATGTPPLRIVLDTELATPPDARLFAEPGDGEAAGPVYLLCRAGAGAKRHRALEAAGARIHGLHPSPDGHVSLRGALEFAWRFGVRRALLEAGPTLTRAFFDAGFVDQFRVYSGAVNGGRGESLADLLTGRLEGRLDRESGPDAVLEAFPVAPGR